MRFLTKGANMPTVNHYAIRPPADEKPYAPQVGDRVRYHRPVESPSGETIWAPDYGIVTEVYDAERGAATVIIRPDMYSPGTIYRLSTDITFHHRP